MIFREWPTPDSGPIIGPTTITRHGMSACHRMSANLIRNSLIWAPEYVRQRLRRIVQTVPLENIWVIMADHYEPLWQRPGLETARMRVALWRSKWPAIARRCQRDSVGSPPQYTFFYPEEEYHSALVEPLAEMVRDGVADVEVHLHHDGEGRQNFIDRISNFCDVLHDRHGLLRERNGKLTFGFIHGNWALDNSRHDGRWCGLNDEIQILHKLCCYADFTMPSGDSTQARLINTIYYCTDDPNRPKSYDSGVPLTSGGSIAGDLLMIPGPLGLRWKGRLLPRLETGELASNNLATPYRVRRWVELAPRIGANSFIKLYTHGAQEQNSAALLSGGLELAFNLLVEEAERRGCSLYFVSAWQMYLAIDALRQCRNPVAATKLLGNGQPAINATPSRR
jgi:hypothetical protein